jgi:hypothetical protein
MKLTINTTEAIGFDLDASFIILVQKGSDNEREIRKLLDDKKEKTPASKSDQPAPPARQVELDAVQLGIFATHDTCHVIIVKRGSETEKRVREFMAQHGKKIPRPSN